MLKIINKCNCLNFYLFSFLLLYHTVDFTHADTMRIYATHEPHSTGTVFSDNTGWGKTTDYILAGQSSRFPNMNANGWMRFDISPIKDNVIVTSVTLNFTVYEDDQTGPLVDFTYMKRDPLTLDFPMKRFDLFYGDPYLTESRIHKGSWSLNLGGKGSTYLQNLLIEDWFSVGIKYDNDPNYYAYIYGWNSHDRPYIDVEFTIPARIIKCYWDKPGLVNEDKIVTMLVQVEGLQEGTLAEWTICEKDPVGDDKVENLNIKNFGVYHSDNKYYAKAEWKCQWQPDDENIPEYYFKVFFDTMDCISSFDPKKLMRVKRRIDITPPKPNPMQFEKTPFPVSSTSIRMTAVEAFDEIDTEVEYKFICEMDGGNGKDKDWSLERTYSNHRLMPNTLYGYKIITRDTSINQNTTRNSKTRHTYTLANIPDLPVISNPKPYSLDLTIKPNENPNNTFYAIFNETDGFYIDEEGSFSEKVTWQTIKKWKTMTIINLSPGIMYSFKVKAKNGEGIKTKWSRNAQGMTIPLSPDIYPVKPYYKIPDSTGKHKMQLKVEVENHATAGSLTMPWKMQWILSADTIIGDKNDKLLKSSVVNDDLFPGQKRSYTYQSNIPAEILAGNYKYYAVVLTDKMPSSDEPKKKSKVHLPFLNKISLFNRKSEKGKP